MSVEVSLTCWPTKVFLSVDSVSSSCCWPTVQGFLSVDSGIHVVGHCGTLAVC